MPGREASRRPVRDAAEPGHCRTQEKKPLLMTFLHPWAIAIGVFAAGLPVLIHFLTRPRPVRLPLSTIRFVREAVHQRRARHRLRDFIILALRTVAILLLGWAVARPLIGNQAVLASEEGGDVARVV